MSEGMWWRIRGCWLLLLAMACLGGWKGALGASQKNKRITGRFDAAARQARKECARRIDEEGNPTCIATLIDRENCVLRCMEPECYEQIYGKDPLEEGELDVARGGAFRQCQREAMLKKEKQQEL